MEEEKAKLAKAAIRIRVYDEYLLEVAAAGGESFPEIIDIMNRHKTLVATNMVRPPAPAAPLAAAACRASL